jgi:MYXO-CTERM domain-containing protein
VCAALLCLFVCLFCENESLLVEEEETLKPAFLFPLLVLFLFCRRRRRREQKEEEEENSNSNNSCGEEDEEAEEEEDAWSLNVDCLGAGFLKCHYCFSLQQSVGGIIFLSLACTKAVL